MGQNSGHLYESMKWSPKWAFLYSLGCINSQSFAILLAHFGVWFPAKKKQWWTLVNCIFHLPLHDSFPRFRSFFVPFRPFRSFLCLQGMGLGTTVPAIWPMLCKRTSRSGSWNWTVCPKVEFRLSFGWKDCQEREKPMVEKFIWIFILVIWPKFCYGNFCESLALSRGEIQTRFFCVLFVFFGFGKICAFLAGFFLLFFDFFPGNFGFLLFFFLTLKNTFGPDFPSETKNLPFFLLFLHFFLSKKCIFLCKVKKIPCRGENFPIVFQVHWKSVFICVYMCFFCLVSQWSMLHFPSF